MELWLVRHSQAKSPSQWLGDDFDRPLTDMGRTYFSARAVALLKAAAKIEVVLCSPALRCLETAEILCEAIGAGVFPKPVPWLRIETKCSAILVQLRKLEAQCAVLVGHQPEMESIYSHFTGELGSFQPGDFRKVSVSY